MAFAAALLTLSMAATVRSEEPVSKTSNQAPLPAAAELPARAELPDPFTMLDGTQVRTREDWLTKRRPELKRLFQHYVYGFAPEGVKISAEVTKENVDVLEGQATLKEVTIRFVGLPDAAPRIHLMLILPKAATAKSPVFIGLNSCGNQTVIPDAAVTIDEAAWCDAKCPQPKESGRGRDKNFWCVDYLVARGYGFATFHQSDVDPDRHDFTDGVHPFFKDLPGPKESHWGTIAAWAWGLSKATDYLVTDPGVDAKQICVIGHSRRGKTALFAGAMDERFALVVPHQSGTGGCALSRDNDQETVERINRVFPHWFADSFTAFDNNERKLPVDQHLLIALVAPRPLFDTEGIQDKWANYSSGFRAIQAADEVYKFLGSKGMVGDAPADVNTDVRGDEVGTLVQYRLDTVHTLTKDYWKGILDYADGHLDK